MEILGRDYRRFVHALGRGKHYRAMWAAARTSRQPVAFFGRYIVGTGDYPWTASIRTPTGPVEATVYSQQDVRTLNEIFFRHDYGLGGQRVVVDLGANIGLSALLFLTRRPDCRVYASEPVPRNLERLRANLAPFADRVEIDARAVSNTGGTAEFIVEDSGRLGGLADYSVRKDVGRPITVQCVPVGELLEPILAREGHIDLIKIDTEGNEHDIIRAIPADAWDRIGTVVWENNDDTTRWADSLEAAEREIGRVVRFY